MGEVPWLYRPAEVKGGMHVDEVINGNTINPPINPQISFLLRESLFVGAPPINSRISFLVRKSLSIGALNQSANHFLCLRIFFHTELTTIFDSIKR
jgi:hypothetical protein